VIECYVGLGSNLGDRLGLLAAAVELLGREEAFAVHGLSRVWETEPVGPPQPLFLNAAVRVATLVSPRATLQRLLAIEERLGRLRRERWGPREIDLDLLLFGERVLPGPPRLPHPRLHERGFVLAPLCELAPDVRHPTDGRTLRQLWLDLPQEARDGVRLLGPLKRRAEISEEEPAEEPATTG
jgi:2-amino-4-hydroxy-6-hydroxymethyldihydropteridine diphosphokinase